MAERSFAREVEHLRLGAGEEFRGSDPCDHQGPAPGGRRLCWRLSGLANLPPHGCPRRCAGHPWRAWRQLPKLGQRVHRCGHALGLGDVPLRGAVAWKSTVGTNVASDALANLASGGVTGGAMVIIGEDYGEGSSIMQERTHAFAMKSQMWLLDPRPDHACIVDLIEKGFQLSEASNTPVMLEVRVRTCHMHGAFVCKDNVAPAFTLEDALAQPKRDLDRIVLPPAAYAHEHEKIAQRLPAAIAFVRDNRLNEWFGPEEDSDGPPPVGIVLQGGMYNNVIRALQYLGLSDAYGNTRVPLYVLNVTYPLVDSEVVAFAKGKQAILMVEEGQPDYLEQAINTIANRQGLTTRVRGKDVLPMAGDYSLQAILAGIDAFLATEAPRLLGNRPPLPTARPVLDLPVVKRLRETVPARPPGLCTGCPERPIFAAMKLVDQERGAHHVSADIGCHLFSILPPFNIGNTTMGFGLGGASAAAFGRKTTGKRSIAVMGDGGFWHNGLTSGIGNAVFNKHDGVFLIVDNFYSSATGGRTSSRRAPATPAARPTTRLPRQSPALAPPGYARSIAPTTSAG
ncbi:thiamine pyrophosphate-dependent enzyme [Novosphingobium pokkalii]|uniref:thiamine pyrophosphate-dependent enzyme n=1 Tax=Novosphingobium pokkalii TaxID=1770194 RepID=UPI0036318044